jgi:hypothetical protein
MDAILRLVVLLAMVWVAWMLLRFAFWFVVALIESLDPKPRRPRRRKRPLLPYCFPARGDVARKADTS